MVATAAAVAAATATRRRVVVTGLGLVTPLATGVAATWSRLIAGRSGVVSLLAGSAAAADGPTAATATATATTTSATPPQNDDERAEYALLPSQIAGRVRRGKNAANADFDVEAWVPKADMSKTSEFMHFAYAAAQQALEDADWFPKDERSRSRTGVCVGSGIGSIEEVADMSFRLYSKGYKKVGPFTIPRMLCNMAAGNISIRYGLRGPNHAVSTACATGAHAIGDAMRFIQYGDADVVVAGGTEASICPAGIAGFCRAKSLSTAFNDRPEEASRPFDRDRDGFVMGEGAGIMILEDYEHAKARGAKIYAEIRGYGLTGDGHHITSPPEDGNGAARAMTRALETAGMLPSDIGYVNAHATSTGLGDIAETKAILSVFGDDAYNLSVSSVKSSIGHLLGAAGSVEAICTVLALYHNILPPTLNLHNVDPRLLELFPGDGRSIDFVPLRARDLGAEGRALRAVLTNSFGFGGTNASLVFARAD
ncbi:thiolase-like protein [Zopfochytrium polystomum]|nr:thiolase-like protein [Zopfochytrium polystomum]